jgi:predicted DNA-binding transcriptional regulator YafY
MAYWESAILEETPECATVRITFANREVAVAQIAATGDVVEIVEPHDLKSAIVGFAKAVLAKYEA